MSDFFNIADKVISEAYPGKPGWWGASRIPNYGILCGAIASALEKQTGTEDGCLPSFKDVLEEVHTYDNTVAVKDIEIVARIVYEFIKRRRTKAIIISGGK